jgi:hypothetical protein
VDLEFRDHARAVPQLNVVSVNECSGPLFRSFVIVAVKVYPMQDIALPAK